MRSTATRTPNIKMQLASTGILDERIAFVPASDLER
jgi:hypothetical protein